MTKQKKYLAFYEKCLIDGKMPSNGLCFSFGGSKEPHEPLKIFEPKSSDQYPPLSKYELWQCFWAADGETDGRHLQNIFTPLRQTIVLFMAAMNDEL